MIYLHIYYSSIIVLPLKTWSSENNGRKWSNRFSCMCDYERLYILKVCKIAIFRKDFKPHQIWKQLVINYRM